MIVNTISLPLDVSGNVMYIETPELQTVGNM